jgi:hypothetical protein
MSPSPCCYLRARQGPTNRRWWSAGGGPKTGQDGRTTEAIGVETLGGAFTPLLSKHWAVPCSTTDIFTTAADGQTQLTIKLYRGNARLVSQATLVEDSTSRAVSQAGEVSLKWL